MKYKKKLKLICRAAVILIKLKVVKLMHYKYLKLWYLIYNWNIA